MFSGFLSFFRPFNCWTLCMRSFSRVVCSIHTLPICLRYLFLLPHFFKITFCYFQSFFFILHFFLVVLVLVSFKTHHLDKKKKRKKAVIFFWPTAEVHCDVRCEWNKRTKKPRRGAESGSSGFPAKSARFSVFCDRPVSFLFISDAPLKSLTQHVSSRFLEAYALFHSGHAVPSVLNRAGFTVTVGASASVPLLLFFLSVFDAVLLAGTSWLERSGHIKNSMYIYVCTCIHVCIALWRLQSDAPALCLRVHSSLFSFLTLQWATTTTTTAKKKKKAKVKRMPFSGLNESSSVSWTRCSYVYNREKEPFFLFFFSVKKVHLSFFFFWNVMIVPTIFVVFVTNCFSFFVYYYLFTYFFFFHHFPLFFLFSLFTSPCCIV